MSREYFVEENSIVRQIWGKSDTILFIFAGASAEFALNKAVDWLYFTGRLPKDPLGRLFSTVSYAREIVFSEKTAANNAIDRISAIHSAVENNRGAKIPDWAYRDVLIMLIDYSIRAFEVLERKLLKTEKQEIFDVFIRVGKRMNIQGLPEDFNSWEKMRESHLLQDFQYSHFTRDLFLQYRKHLGLVRYKLLTEVQILVVPSRVRNLMGYHNFPLLGPLLGIYKLSRNIKLDWLLKAIILPPEYKQEFKGLDRVSG